MASAPAWVGVGAAVSAVAALIYLDNMRQWAHAVGEELGVGVDEMDAFRHALTSAELTRQTLHTQEIAKTLGDLNEIINSENWNDYLNGSSRDRNQDLWNNAAGRNIGLNSISSDDSVWQVYEALRQSRDGLSGPLVIDKNLDPRVGDESFPIELIPGIFPDRYREAFLLLQRSVRGTQHALEAGWESIQDWWDRAKSTPQPRRDPLVFDLDNDGLETTGINAASPILFDHDGDGIKTATGWVNADDAFLVLDRNGNGTIDTGRELFGDSTPLAGGGTAADGFAALAQEDTNADGVVNANDARFDQLRLWRDLNQDGISQANELSTLAANGIVSITVAKTEHTQVLPNGNQLGDLGSYTRSDGSVGGLGEVTADLADIDLIEDTFHREFADTIPLTALAETLPEMQGSGQVRDLREAMSLGTPTSDALVLTSAQN